ncbi:cytochrome b/b6 domain-containing protein [Streptomyces sp. NPDC059717]|uniref:cytochrome b/b6 domain-containing protein n=1 Tax=Streptomyces sp. NPDC059717 TaxID=3346922 RepID=UPI0036925C6E
METSAQKVGLVVLAVVVAITVAHATVVVGRRLVSRRAASDPSLRLTVQVWDLGVRLSHWAIFASIAVLSGTGYFLANPIPSQGHGSGNVTMASIRFIHLLFAVLFTVFVLFRIYWFFGGNRWAGWRYWMPTTRSRFRALRRQAAYYAFVRRTPPPEIGHNALAGAAYTVIYLFFAVQIVSGFALLFADGAALHFLHGVVMWVILAFLIHHVYSAVLIDTEDNSAMVASIFTGNKKLTKEYLAAAEDTYDD